MIVLPAVPATGGEWALLDSDGAPCDQWILLNSIALAVESWYSAREITGTDPSSVAIGLKFNGNDWRLYVSGDDFLVQEYVSATWTTRFTFKSGGGASASTDVVTVASMGTLLGSTLTINGLTGVVVITGTQNTTTQTVGQTVTITGPDLTPYATTAYVNSVVDEIEPAIISANSLIVVTSGANTTTLAADTTPSFTSVTSATGTFSTSLTLSGLPVVVVGSIPAGGANTQVQYNSGGTLAGDTTFTFNDGTNTISGSNVSVGGTCRAETGNFNNLNIEPYNFGWTAAVTGTLVLEEAASYSYTINSLVGTTGKGTVSGTLKVNNVDVQGISATTWNTAQAIKTATGNNSVVANDRVSFVVSGTSNGQAAGFTLNTTRTS